MNVPKQPSQKETQIEIATCECCGLTEEYTVAYIDNVRRVYAGKWICGLCSEAVEYETIRRRKQRIEVEDALAVHMRFCGEFRASAAADPTTGFVSVFSRILRRNRQILDSPRTVKSAPGSPVDKNRVADAVTLGRSESCLPAFSGEA